MFFMYIEKSVMKTTLPMIASCADHDHTPSVPDEPDESSMPIVNSPDSLILPIDAAVITIL